jgi:hypothetical protein
MRVLARATPKRQLRKNGRRLAGMNPYTPRRWAWRGAYGYTPAGTSALFE